MGDPAGAARLYTAHLAHSDFETLEPEEGSQEGCQEGSHDVTMMSHKSCLSTGLCPDFLRSYVHNNPWGRCLGRMPLKKNFSSASLHVDFITMVWWCGSTGLRIPQVSTGETRLAWEIQGGLSVTWYWIVEGHCDILLYFWYPEWPPEKVIQLSFSRDAKNTCVAMQFIPQPEKKLLADLLGNFLLCGASCHTFDWWLWALIILKCFDWGSNGICSIVDEIHGIFSSGFSGDWSFSKTWLLHTTSPLVKIITNGDGKKLNWWNCRRTFIECFEMKSLLRSPTGFHWELEFVLRCFVLESCTPSCDFKPLK